MLNDYIRQLEKDLELEAPLRKETEGVYTFVFDEGVDVTITDLNPGFGFHCAIAPFPKTEKETFVTQAMLANLFGQGTEGAILGLDEKGEILTLAIEYPKYDSYKTFQEGLEDFLNAAEYWRQEATRT